MGAKKTEDGKSLVWVVVLYLVFVVVAWPYFLGTWLAVQLGADNPSAARSVTGWFLEVLWLGGLVSLAGRAWLNEKQKKDAARRLQLLTQQRKREFGSGASLYERADEWVSMIAASEAARTGWLGNPADLALLTLLWVVLSGESWWSTAEAEHGQGDQGFGTAESERDAGGEPDLGVDRFDPPVGEAVFDGGQDGVLMSDDASL